MIGTNHKSRKDATPTSLKTMDNFSSSINNHKFHDLDNFDNEDDWKKSSKSATLIPLVTLDNNFSRSNNNHK